MSWTPDIPKPDNYVEYTNNSGITFYIPTDSAPANVPYSFEVFAGSIDREQIIDEDGLFVKVDGSRAMTGDFDAGSQNIVNANNVNATNVASSTATVSGNATVTNTLNVGDAHVTKTVAADDSAVRNIIHSTSAPTSSNGDDGDIWIQYEA